MNRKYILVYETLIREVPEIEITEEKYYSYKSADNVLSNCMAIEERYEILLRSYLEFENEIIQTATRSMIRELSDYIDAFNFRLDVNIRLINLLTASKIYKDHLGHYIKECAPDNTNVLEDLHSLFSSEYDKSRDYRIIDSLRNHVQHRGIPIHLLTLHRSWTSIGEHGRMEHALQLSSLRSYFENDMKFKKSVLKDLDEKIDLVAAVRGYMESISNIHTSVRDIINSSVNSARALLDDAHKQYSAIFDHNTSRLIACICSDNVRIESVPLLLYWDDIRIKLQKQNGKLINLKKRFVTNKA